MSARFSTGALRNTLFFFMMAGSGFSHIGGYIALAVWAGLRAMPVLLFPLSIEYMYSALVLCLLLPPRLPRDLMILFWSFAPLADYAVALRIFS